MAAHIGQPAPSRRFVKIYLITWGLLAIGSLVYLTALTFPQSVQPPPRTAEAPASDGGGPSKEIAEVKGSLGEIRKDVTELKTSVGERVENEKVVKTRLTALEGRVSTIDGAPAPATDGDSKADAKAAPKDGEIKDSDAKGSDAKDGGAVPGKAVAEAAPAVKPPFMPIETGSITPKDEAKDEIVFGEAVVTKGGQEFAVQLAAAPSVLALKQSWGQLAERHATALTGLHPRVVPPRTEGGIYRLIAGPLPSKADAERICSELHVAPKACIPTPYAGAPL